MVTAEHYPPDMLHLSANFDRLVRVRACKNHAGEEHEEER